MHCDWGWKRYSVIFLTLLGVFVVADGQSDELPDAPSIVANIENGASTAPKNSQTVDWDWPREADLGEEKLLVYQPQLEDWQGDTISLYAALSVEDKNTKKLNYGVVWFTGQTEVDKVNRRVTIDNFEMKKLRFPALQPKEAEYDALLKSKLSHKSRVIALDRLEAELVSVSTEKNDIKGLTVKNDPPKVIFSTKPSMLVVIDGPPRFSDVGGTSLQKVLNSQAFILFDADKKKYYLNVMDGWLEAATLEGPWSYVAKVPDDLKEISKAIEEQQKRKTPEGSTPPSLKEAKKKGKIPEIYVSEVPAELLISDGLPQFETIPAAKLEYVKNTTGNIFRDPETSMYYILLAGRWFRSKSLENGPW